MQRYDSRRALLSSMNSDGVIAESPFAFVMLQITITNHDYLISRLSVMCNKYLDIYQVFRGAQASLAEECLASYASCC